jgi:hypothetical protein
MVQRAGCGVAMGNAIDAVKAVARRVTLSNDDDGVAHAIDMMISPDRGSGAVRTTAHCCPRSLTEPQALEFRRILPPIIRSS